MTIREDHEEPSGTTASKHKRHGQRRDNVGSAEYNPPEQIETMSLRVRS
jgi:hypothetical protein